MTLLIQWAVTSSVLILIVLAVRFLLKDRLSARLRYALWGVVLLRLLAPFQVELPGTGDALPALASNLAQDVTPWLEDTMLYAFPTANHPGAPVKPGEAPQYSPTLHGSADPDQVYHAEDGVARYFFMMPASELLSLVWKWGAALCLIVMFYSNWRFSVHLKKHRRPLEGLDAPIPVYVAANLPSPCLFGVLHPAAYVTPQTLGTPDTLRHVLAHELTHYAHWDHLWSFLRTLALALHWYNPLVWLAVGLSKGDGELACDEGAVARLGEAERIPYGRTLVDMVAARSLQPGDLLSCSTAMTGGKKSIQQRVAQIVKKPETVKTALFAVIAVLALSAVFVFTTRGEGDKPGHYHTFKDDVKNAQSIHLSGELTPSYLDSTAITDPNLLEQARDLLWQDAADWLNPPPVLEDFNPASLHTLTLTDQKGREVRYQLVFSEMEINSSPQVYVITEGSLSHIRGSRVAVLLEPDTVYQIYELMRLQKPPVTYRIEDDQRKEQLTQLFLGDKECVAANDTPEHEMQEWLTNWTSLYIVYYGLPEIPSATELGWYAHAVDAGSFYFIRIPDHLVDQVVAVCQSPAL